MGLGPSILLYGGVVWIFRDSQVFCNLHLPSRNKDMERVNGWVIGHEKKRKHYKIWAPVRLELLFSESVQMYKLCEIEILTWKSNIYLKKIIGIILSIILVV